MKKYLFIILSLGFILAKAQTTPTCSLDAVFIQSNKSGVYPDSATNFTTGQLNQSYIQNITIKVPKDTIQSILKICFTRFVVSTPSNVVNYGLPAGLQFASSSSVVANGNINGSPSLRFPGNANNCASIFGVPSVAGNYLLKLQVQAYGTTILSVQQCPALPNYTTGLLINTTNLNYYSINIINTTGINHYSIDKPYLISHNNNQVLLQNKMQLNLTAKLFDIQGRQIKTFIIDSQEAFVKINEQYSLTPGIYLLNISSQNQTWVDKFIVHP